MPKVVKRLPVPEETLILPSREVNAGDTVDKSLSGTSVHKDGNGSGLGRVLVNPYPHSCIISKPVSAPIPDGYPISIIHKFFRFTGGFWLSVIEYSLDMNNESSPLKQVAETQHAEEPVAAVDATKSIETFKSTEDLGNHLKPANVKKRVRVSTSIFISSVHSEFTPGNDTLRLIMLDVDLENYNLCEDPQHHANESQTPKCLYFTQPQRVPKGEALIENRGRSYNKDQRKGTNRKRRIMEIYDPDPAGRDTPILVGRGFLYTYGSILNTIERITSTFDRIFHQMFRAAKTSLDTAESDSDDEEDRILTIQMLLTIRDGGGSDASMCCGEAIDEMLKIKLFVAGTNEEIFTSEACANTFNIDKPIYSELCHEFYSTYEFDEVCAADELRTKKIVKFRLCGRAFNWKLMKFPKRLELYNSKENEEEGINVYFQVLRVLYKMITYVLCQTTGYDKMQKNNLWLLSMFEARHQNGALDTTPLKELIDSEGRLIPKAPEPGVSRVAILIPPRASMQDFVPLQGAYNPPGYDQQQYDQYYLQYPPQQQKQPDNDE
uniref:Uncharacterized protein n=1 Tax=Tanacetum cinerariifolium TaxID=118510 RepID=A0A6L2KZZ7_TANCI|nr:hypothetical protein [Tanacetum cinerariifolium]